MKKILSFLVTFNLLFMLIWAMPGFESYLPDKSGEYIYYKDNTFHRESYLGILYYDESTVQIRYFAPKNVKEGLPENEVSILVSMNPDSPHFEMTGERILSTILPNTDDVDIVNYLHSILYDFSSCRIKMNNITGRNIDMYQEISQFGGNVKVTYDCTLPIFNIKTIKKSDGTKLLECCTTGQLTDEFDTSFDKFSGIQQGDYKKENKKYKSKKSQKYTFENQSIKLDNNWTQKMENMWALGNDSILSLSALPAINETEDKNKIENFLIKYFAKSKMGKYLIFDTLKIESREGTLQIKGEIYDPLTSKITVNNIIIKDRKDSNAKDLLSLVTFKQPWLNNQKYYENILGSYKN